jgi:hypothetical protein
VSANALPAPVGIADSIKIEIGLALSPAERFNDSFWQLLHLFALDQRF